MTTQAEVINANHNGFQLLIKQEVPVSQARAYQQFIRISEWWHSEHTWFGNAKALSITPEVGGCFCERNGKQQALHMTVSYVVPEQEIRMIGGLGPLQMLGVQGGMSWKFNAISPTTSEIILHYQVTGYMPEGLDKLAPIVDKVQQEQVARLVSTLEQQLVNN
ncbi:hypothetical protein [Thalassotalea sp. G2M2-11]|uniref:hypothetical protein n=1 Tax=Thalassotalea sp. G2M2-11 TaxID=2787627 RepID=UPI0019D1EC10|nr:hypothetical protein [Thalassotalea sp. G2M2-11]